MRIKSKYDGEWERFRVKISNFKISNRKSFGSRSHRVTATPEVTGVWREITGARRGIDEGWIRKTSFGRGSCEEKKRTEI